MRGLNPALIHCPNGSAFPNENRHLSISASECAKIYLVANPIGNTIMNNNEKFEFLKNIYIFHSLHDSELEKLAAQFDVKEYPDGEEIFREGSSGDYFFLVFSGTVKLSIDGNYIGKIGRNANFGEEALLNNNNSRSATATSLGDVTLLGLEKKHFLALLKNNTQVKDVMECISESYALARKKNFSWLGEDEVVRFIDQRHIAVLFRRLLLPLFFILLIIAGIIVSFSLGQTWYSTSTFVILTPLIIIIPWVLWIFVDWGNDYYIVTSNRVVWLEKVVWLYDQRKESPHQTILSINTRSSQIQRILHYADVVVRTYTGEITMNDTAHPEYLEGIAKTYWHLAEESLEQERITNITGTIRKKLGFEEEVPEAENVPENDDGEDTLDEQSQFILPQWLGNLLKTRYEIEGVITYRKHIFILLKQIWFFSLLFIILTFLLVIFFDLSSSFLGRVLLLAIGAGILFTLGNLGYRYADWRNDLFQITSNEIVDMDKKPLGEATRRSAPLENILSLDYKRANIIQRIFNFGTVSINVGNAQLDFENVAKPDMVQAELFERYYAALRQKEEKEAQRHRDDVVEFLAIYHEENKRYERYQTETEDTEESAES